MKKLIALVLNLSLIFVIECHDKNEYFYNPYEPEINTATVTSTLSQSELGGTGLVIKSLYQENAPVTNSQFSTKVSTKGTQLLFILDSNSQVRGLTLSIINRNKPSIMKGDALSTAYSLIFLTPGICTTNPDSTYQRIEKLNTLPSFNALVSHLKNNLANNILTNLLSQQETNTLLAECIDEFATHTIKKPISDENDLWFWVTKIDGENYKLENYNWRWVNVYRKDVKPDNSEKYVLEIWRHMPGGVPYSLGSILQMITNGWKPIPTTHTDNTYINPDVSKLEYYVIGPGRKHSSIELPSSINKDYLQEFCATGLFYLLFPAIDLVSGGAAFLKGISEIISSTTQIAKAIATDTKIAKAGGDFLRAGDFWTVGRALVDFTFAAANNLFLSYSNIMVVEGLISQSTAAMLKLILPIYLASFGIANVKIMADFFLNTPEFSKYEHFTRIPILLSPINNSTISALNPKLDWEVPYNFQSTYIVQISEDPSFSTKIVDISGVTPSEYNIPTSILPDNEQYYWRVKSEYEGGSSWSEVWSFTTSSSYLIGTISGKITNASNNNPISGATITTKPQTSNAITNASGDYTIDNVNPGNYTIMAARDGYRNATKSIVVQPNEVTTANLSMIPDSVAGACKNVPYCFALGSTVDGQDAHGAEGDFSCYSDVYTTGGVRISPWLGDGRAYYDYGDATGRGNVNVTIQWVDNGWWDGDKAIEIYNWNQNKWDRIATWRGNDCQEHYSTYSIPLNTERIYEGKIRVAVWSSGDSVVHLRTIKVY